MNSRLPPRSARHQRGQSLIEMAVACIVLVPLAAGIMLLGQYMHMQASTQAAARQAAWAATVSPQLLSQQLPSSSQVQQDVRLRDYSDTQAKFSGTTANASNSFGDEMLTTFAGQQLLKPNDVNLVTYSQTSAPSYLDKALDGIGSVLRTLPPTKQGLVTATVQANAEKLIGTDGSPLAMLDPLNSLQLNFNATTVVLADSWDAGGGGEDFKGAATSTGTRTVRSVIQPLVPTEYLGGSFDNVLNGVVDTLGKIPIVDDILTPGLSNFELGKAAPDVIPTDKLVKYGAVK